MGWGFISFFVFFAGRTVIRRKEGWHPGREKSTEPRQRWPRLAGTGGEGGPGGGLASRVLGFALPKADCTEKVPRRRKAPDFSNSDVQRATLAIHSLGLVCVFFLFFLFFFLLFLSRRLLWRRRCCRLPWGRGQRSPKSEPEHSPSAAAFPSPDVS